MRHDGIHLYVDAQFASPYAMSVFVALEEKQLAYDLSTVDLARGQNRDVRYALPSLTQRVPMLRHDDFFISESSAITEYLDEVFPDRPVYPQDRHLRARARQIQAWLRSDLMPIRQECSTEVVFYGAASGPLSSAAQDAAEKLYAAAEALIPAHDLNLCGKWCVADTDLALMLNRLIFNGNTVPERLKDYAAYQWQRPSVRRWVERLRPPL